MSYFEFRTHAVNFDAATRRLTCLFFGQEGRAAAALEDLEGFVLAVNGKRIPLASYTRCEEIQLPSVKFPVMPAAGHWDLTLKFSAPRKKLPHATLKLRLFADRVEFSAVGAAIEWQGTIRNGADPEHEVFAAADETHDDVLRCACGPAANPQATMLYNRQDDSAVKCDGGTMALDFDWKRGEYRCGFTVPVQQAISFCRAEHICQTLFHFSSWTPLAKEHQFPTPPVGWMSWYSLRFDTCEKTVLENARKMHELFQNFTEKICIWVDWEWCHADLKGRGSDGVDVFHPRKDAYPHGLKSVSDAIRKLGEVPALWCGATVEGRINKVMKAHPEFLLTDYVLWPGHLWFDLTNPGVAQEYIPEVFKQFLAWGYEVFKWDCWLNSIRVHDEFHDLCFDRNKSMERCLHELISAARKVIGKERYLLGCTIDDRSTCGGGEFFDGFRIGGDVFSWQDFRLNGVDNTYRYYPLHNTRLYLDPDTLVLRSEYSDDFQARTRVAFLALTGMQLTVGDPLASLDGLRIDALKRAMPVASLRPVELLCKTPPGKLAKTLTAVERPFGAWYIAGVFNFDSRRRKAKLRYRELGLPPGQYAAFDFWSQRLLGVSRTGVDLPLAPGESAAVRLTPLADTPTLIGTSRHLLQGAVELTGLAWDEEKAELSGTVRAVANDPLTLAFYLPEPWQAAPKPGISADGRVVKLTLSARKNTLLHWSIRFTRKENMR